MLPERAQRLLGYGVHDAIEKLGGYCGMVGLRDPIELLREGKLTSPWRRQPREQPGARRRHLGRLRAPRRRLARAGHAAPAVEPAARGGRVEALGR